MVTSNEERIRRLNETSYQETFWVKKRVFDMMLSVLREAYSILHSKGGKPPLLSVAVIKCNKMVFRKCHTENEGVF